MRDQTNKNKTVMYFLSAFNSSYTKHENIERHDDLAKLLSEHNLPYVECLGSFDGAEEISMMVETTEENESIIKMIANSFEQVCYLVVEHNATFDSYLEYYNDDTEYMGVFKRIKSTEGVSNWTKLGMSDDNIYTTIK